MRFAFTNSVWSQSAGQVHVRGNDLFGSQYEDNVSGKVTDEWFLQLSHKYEEKRLDLKTKTARLRQKLAEADSAELHQQRFLRQCESSWKWIP